MTNSEYYKNPAWSYSSLKVILDSGIDYAVGLKNGTFQKNIGSAADLGQYIHYLVLGGENDFIVSPYRDYRTAEARNWKNEQIDSGMTIINIDDYNIAKLIAKNIKNHPNCKNLVVGESIKHEVELLAKTTDGISLKGKADAIHYKKNGKPDQLCDIKTTSQFDQFFKKAQYNHYDLQAAIYTMISGISESEYWFVVAETVEPYRVQVMHATQEFVESGERKLRKCIDEVIKFNKRSDKTPNFLIEEIKELGDYSL